MLNNVTKRNIMVLEDIVKSCPKAQRNEADEQAIHWIESLIDRLQSGKAPLEREHVEYDENIQE